MPFKRPDYSKLTDSQRKILNLPVGKNHVITGAPGTGKSVLAIYRASDMHKAHMKVLLLVYNKPLMLYISSAVGKLCLNAEVKTWNSWISSFYNEHFGHNPPAIHGNAFTYDWAIIKQDFQRVEAHYDHIIIDEAQDFPIELIEALRIISSGISCFMDENQTIADTHTTYQDVVMALDVPARHTLRENFRNPKEIFDFAKLYSNGGNLATPIHSINHKPEMVKCKSYATSNELIFKMVKYIRNQMRGCRSIGVFVNPISLRSTYEELRHCLNMPGDPDVFMYKPQTEFDNPDFDKDGVFVLSFGTMKGLEFDGVLIPKCERIKSRNNQNLDRNIIYVAATRASKELVCFYKSKTVAPGCIDIFSPLAGHEEVLRWRGINE